MVSLQEHKGQKSQTRVFSKAEMEARPQANARTHKQPSGMVHFKQTLKISTRL